MQYDDVITNPRWRTDGRHIENRFWLYLGAILTDQREIWKLERRWRITCRYRSHDQNCNFRKFKMSDGRYVENNIISISQPRIIRFRSNFVGRCTSQFPWWALTKNRNYDNSRWRTDAILKIVFWLSRRHIGRSTRNLEQRWRITCRYRSRYQNCNFRKLKMADGRHFENSFISISQSELSDFDQIWYADANFHSEYHGYLTKKSIFFQIQDCGRTP